MLDVAERRPRKITQQVRGKIEPAGYLGQLELPLLDELRIGRRHLDSLELHALLKHSDPPGVVRSPVQCLPLAANVGPRVCGQLVGVAQDSARLCPIGERTRGILLDPQRKPDAVLRTMDQPTPDHAIPSHQRDMVDIRRGQLRLDLPRLIADAVNQPATAAVDLDSPGVNRPKRHGPTCSVTLDLGDHVPMQVVRCEHRHPPAKRRHLGIGFAVKQVGQRVVVELDIRFPLPLIDFPLNLADGLSDDPDRSENSRRGKHRQFVDGHPSSRSGEQCVGHLLRHRPR